MDFQSRLHEMYGINNTRIVNAYGQQFSYSYMLLIDPDKISRMPEKRPYTLLYLSSCTRQIYSYVLRSDSSSSAITKLTFKIQKVTVTKDTVIDGDEGKGMEVVEGGSVSVNVRSDAGGDGVADEQVVANKGVTMDTVIDGEEEGRVWRSTKTCPKIRHILLMWVISCADYNKIYKIRHHNIIDKFLVTSADDGMRFQASALSLYAHALRVHFMSRRYFGTRKIYVDLAKTKTYQKHKDNIFLIIEPAGNVDIKILRNKYNFQNYIGVETLKKFMAFMFPKKQALIQH
jgi:hypothetical protein